MEQFPNSLNVSNILSFGDIKKNLLLQNLRKKIFKHILNNNENDFFDIEKFNRNPIYILPLIDIIIKELQELGWNTSYSYNNTALFIYSTIEKPSSCY